MVLGSVTQKQDFLNAVFHETPSEVPAFIALFLYSLGGAAVLWLTIRTKTWFMLVVTITAWLEVLGFAIRLLMILGSSPTLGQFIGMQAFLIITPVLLPIANYIMVGRLMHQGDESKLKIKPHWVARIFTGSDIVSLVVQSGGAGLISSDDKGMQDMGTAVMLVGLLLQLVFFSFFTSFTLYIHRSKAFALRHRDHWQNVFICLYVTIALMYVRNIFRVTEFAMGYDGYLASHEEFFYVFDFAVVFTCIVVFGVYHFGLYLNSIPSNDAVEPADAEDGRCSSTGCCEVTVVKPCQGKPSCELTPVAQMPGSANV